MDNAYTWMYAYVCIMYVPGAFSEMLLRPLELELQMVIRCSVGAGTLIQVFCKYS